jgi:uncharacterized protein involved in exopolysaccharide biosynthesis
MLKHFSDLAESLKVQLAQAESDKAELRKVLKDERNSANELTKSLVDKVSRIKELEGEKAELVRRCAEIADDAVKMTHVKWVEKYGNVSTKDVIFSLLPKE